MSQVASLEFDVCGRLGGEVVECMCRKPQISNKHLLNSLCHN